MLKYNGQVYKPSGIATIKYNGVTYYRSSRLPSGYTELEYIQSSGTQYINTNFTNAGTGEFTAGPDVN